MACPLALLRQYNVNKYPIVDSDDHIVFGDVSWPKSAKTSYLMYNGAGKTEEKLYYTLGSLVYLLKNERLSHRLYIRQAITDNAPMVRRPDRRDLLAYLNGETATTSSIDRFAPLEPPTKTKRGSGDALDTGAAKKARLSVAVDKQEDGDVVEIEAITRLDNERVQRAKEQFAAKLDAPQEVTVLVNNIKSLSEAMSVEKIAAIKAKRIAKKRTTIKENNDIEMMDTSAFNVIMDMDTVDMKEVLSRERHFRTRATILQSSNKDFLMNVMHILESIAAKEAAVDKKIMTPKVPSPTRRQIGPLPGYDRYDQQRFVSQNAATEDFVIDTMGSYHGMTLEYVTDGCVKPAVVPKPAAPALVIPNKRSSKTPIIIVPSSESSLITIYNVMDILQDLTFKPTAEKKARATKRNNEILLQRRKQGNLTVPYLVFDNPLKLKKEDWNRVVAVFVMGPEWQFKGWPFAGDPIEIFSKIPGFHLKYDDMPVEANVSRWAVKIIELNRTRRHLDRAAIIKFWEALDQHMTKNKPHLRF